MLEVVFGNCGPGEQSTLLHRWSEVGWRTKVFRSAEADRRPRINL